MRKRDADEGLRSGFVQALLQQTKAGELGVPSPDNKYAVIEVECLGACGFATPLMINEEFVESVTADNVSTLLARLPCCVSCR